MRKLILTACLAATLAACGSSMTTNQPATTTTTTLPCTQTILFQGGGPAPANTLFGAVPFNFTSLGRLDVILDWTSPASRLGVYVVPQGTCTLAEFNARSCTFIIRSEPSTIKPRKVSAPNVDPGSYILLIANFGTQDESASTQVIYSSASCPPLSVAPAHGEAGPVVGRAASAVWR